MEISVPGAVAIVRHLEPITGVKEVWEETTAKRTFSLFAGFITPKKMAGKK